MSISNFGEQAFLAALFNNVAVQEADRFVKLHIGDPGEDGTGNPAAETTRKSLTGAAPVAGTFTSVNELEWTNVAGTETYSHISIWDAVVAGNCWWSGPMAAAKAVIAGDTFKFATGAVTVSLD